MEFGKVEFNEGSYLGQIEDGKANGYGVMNYKNGDIYVGEWQDNCQTGQGVKKTANYVSMGYFVKGMRDGKCCTVEDDASSNRTNYYIGNYYNDVKSGHGVFVNYLHEAIVGNFKNDLANGKGFLSHFPTINDGYFAEGNFVNGRLSGQYTSYARTIFSNGTTFYGHSLPDLNYYSGFGEWIDKGAGPERRIGYHNKSVNERSAYNFKGVKIFNHGGYDSKKSVEEGDYGSYVIGKTDGVFSKIYDDGAMYIGEYELNKMKGDGIYAIFEPAKYGQPKPNLFFRIIDGKETIKLNSASLVTLEIKRVYGDNIEVWNNGTFVIHKWGVSERTRSERTINFPTYQGMLNNGYGSYSSSPYLGESTPTYSSTHPTSNEVKTTDYKTSSVDTSNSYSQVKTVNTSTNTYTPPKHDYGDGYGEKISFKERVRLELENKKQMRELKNNPPPVIKEPKKEVKENETVKKLNEEYEFENHRQILTKVKVKKEVHIIPPSVETIKVDAFIGDETIKEIKGGQNLKYIEGCAFSGCKNLEIVDFSKTHLRAFESNVFENCTNLKTVILPRWDVVPTVKPNAFTGCKNLSLIRKKPNEPIDIEVFLKNQYHEETKAEKEWRLVCEKRNKEWEEKERQEKEVKEKSYKDNGYIIEKKGNFTCLTVYDNKVKKLYVPNGAQKIESKAFDKIKDIVEEVIFSFDTVVIEKEIFKDSKSLEKVDFSRATGCNGIDTSCFENCIKLKTLEFNGKGTISSFAFSKCNSLESVTLPNLYKIYENAFKDCDSLKEVNSKKVYEVYDYAFCGCTSLKVVNTPNLHLIHKNAFLNCVSLEKLVVNKDCKIESGALPKQLVSNVKKLGETKVITFAKKDKNPIKNILFKLK